MKLKTDQGEIEVEVQEDGTLKVEEPGYTINTYGVIERDDWASCGLKDRAKEVGNWFATRGEAEEEIEKRKAIVRIKKFVRERIEAKDGEFNFAKGKPFYYIEKTEIDGKWTFVFNRSNGFIKPYSPIGYFKKAYESIIEHCREDLEKIF